MGRYNEELSEEFLSRVYEETHHLMPSAIADEYHIEVKEEDLPYSTIGIYTRISQRAFILINDSDTKEMQEYTIALCLYYHFDGRPRIVMREAPSDGDYSAGHFAYQLHLRSDGEFAIPDEILEKGRSRLN